MLEENTGGDLQLTYTYTLTLSAEIVASSFYKGKFPIIGNIRLSMG